MVDECTEYPDRGATIENYTFVALDGRDAKSLKIGGVASAALDVDIYKGIGCGFCSRESDRISHLRSLFCCHTQR